MEDTKVCFKCRVQKPLSDFYKHAQMEDGHVNKCKECNKKDVRKNYRKNIKHFKLYDQDRNIKRRDYIKAKNEEYARKNPEKVASAKKRWQENNKEKRAAHVKLGNSLRDGKITKGPCCKCGNSKTEAHHDDYTKPLEVRWFCIRCHNDYHIEQRRKQIEAM